MLQAEFATIEYVKELFGGEMPDATKVERQNDRTGEVNLNPDDVAPIAVVSNRDPGTGHCGSDTDR